MEQNNQHKRSRPDFLLFKFAFFPKYQEDIKNLAETLADKEPWDFSGSIEQKYAILKNYLEYYFRRLKEESKVAYTKDNQYCIFNTGLVTANQEDIFAFFEVNHSQNKIVSSPYYFKGFLKRSDNLLLRNFGPQLPNPANFFEKPELLLLNPRYEIVPDIEHII